MSYAKPIHNYFFSSIQSRTGPTEDGWFFVSRMRSFCSFMNDWLVGAEEYIFGGACRFFFRVLSCDVPI
jgi:hypothetical protein